MPADRHGDHAPCGRAHAKSGHLVLALAALPASALALLSACGGDGGDSDPATSLSSAATGTADGPSDAAVDVGGSSLDDLTRRLP